MLPLVISADKAEPEADHTSNFTVKSTYLLSSPCTKGSKELMSIRFALFFRCSSVHAVLLNVEIATSFVAHTARY